jgi:hypothetical protein
LFTAGDAVAVAAEPGEGHREHTQAKELGVRIGDLASQLWATDESL